MKIELPDHRRLQPGPAGVVVLATCVGNEGRPNIITLGMSPSTTLGVLDYMEATGIVQRVRLRKRLYFLKDTYDEERIETMIHEAEERDKSGDGRSRKRSKYDPIIDLFLESENELVRVDVVGKNPSFMASVLYGGIKARELGDRIESYIVNNCLYLEKV